MEHVPFADGLRARRADCPGPRETAASSIPAGWTANSPTNSSTDARQQTKVHPLNQQKFLGQLNSAHSFLYSIQFLSIQVLLQVHVPFLFFLMLSNKQKTSQPFWKFASHRHKEAFQAVVFTICSPTTGWGNPSPDRSCILTCPVQSGPGTPGVRV